VRASRCAADQLQDLFREDFLAVSLATLLVGTSSSGRLRSSAHPARALILPFVIGLVTAVMAEICIYFFEYVFDVSTDMSLHAALRLQHPLLKRLQSKPPAATTTASWSPRGRAGGAGDRGQPIRARVCALFHDIGKLSQPEYFIENNVESENSTGAEPRIGSLIILNHVKEGVELARKYKLNASSGTPSSSTTEPIWSTSSTCAPRRRAPSRPNRASSTPGRSLARRR
jgi:putative nucleotidyltransferase with HDIG domain